VGESSDVVKKDEEQLWVEHAIIQMANIQDTDLRQLDLTEGLDDLKVRVLETERDAAILPLRRRRLSRKAGTLAIVALIVSSAGAAAAVRSGALTGLFGNQSADTDRSEYVNVAAPNFASVAAQLFNQDLSDGLRFAPGTNTRQVLESYVNGIRYLVTYTETKDGPIAARATKKYGLLEQVTGIKSKFLLTSQCTWQRSWISAYQAHNRGQATAAIKGMLALNNIMTTTPTKNGTFTGHLMQEVNSARTNRIYARSMKHGDLKSIQNNVSINCAGQP
jgi:hypothetical protein